MHLEVFFYISRFGFGNWTEVKDYMEFFGAKFTQNQI